MIIILRSKVQFKRTNLTKTCTNHGHFAISLIQNVKGIYEQSEPIAKVDILI